MSKASGGTRTVSSANAAASRTFAQSAIGGGNISKISIVSKAEENNFLKISKDILYNSLKDKWINHYKSFNEKVLASALKSAFPDKNVSEFKLDLSKETQDEWVKKATIGKDVEILYHYGKGGSAIQRFSYKIGNGEEKVLARSYVGKGGFVPNEFIEGFQQFAKDLKKK